MKRPVIIIGAGWSGLACAITLIQAGYPVCLLESARQAGGRARSIKTKRSNSIINSHLPIDNGQHIMLGAYHFTRKIFKTLGLIEADLLQTIPLELKLFSADESSLHLKAPLLPAPLHLLFALLSLQGLNLIERFKIIKMLLKLKTCNYKLENDLSVEDLLIQYQQTKKLIKALWEPLCLATMNTPIHYASAQIFLNIVKDSFTKNRQDSDLLFFKQDLSQTFCSPAIQFIKNNGSSVHFADKVTHLQLSHSTSKNANQVDFNIQTQQNNYHSQHVVLATPAHITDKLLSDSSLSSCLIPKQASLSYSYEPIYTIYIQYPVHIKLPLRMVGLFGCKVETIAQWAIDRSLTGQAGLIAVVISGSGNHTQMSSMQLIESIHQELKLVISHLPNFLEYKIIKEKKATFSCRVDIEKQRPKNQTSISGLYLAGDYTETGYPATLEGAIKSGVMAARQIIQN